MSTSHGMCPDETTPSCVELNAFKCDPCDAVSISLSLPPIHLTARAALPPLRPSPGASCCDALEGCHVRSGAAAARQRSPAGSAGSRSAWPEAAPPERRAAPCKKHRNNNVFPWLIKKGTSHLGEWGVSLSIVSCQSTLGPLTTVEIKSPTTISISSVEYL